MPRKPPQKPSAPDDESVANFVGNDVYERVVVRLSEAGTSFLQPVEPVGLAQLGQRAQEGLGILQRLVVERQQLLIDIDDMVEVLRGLGVSWNLIGWSVGTSGEAARQRWGTPKLEEPAPPAKPAKKAPAKPVTAKRRSRRA